MENQKKYFRVKDIMIEAVKMAQEDPTFQVVEKNCPLDYHHLLYLTEEYEVKLSCFNVVGCTEYSSNSGIRGVIQFFGQWLPEHITQYYKQTADVYMLETLSQSKDAYLRMGVLVNLICYYANQFIREHADRFDRVVEMD